MTRQLLKLSILAFTLFATPLFFGTTASAAIEIVEIDEKEPTIHFSNRSLQIDNAMGETVCIYDIRGVMIQTFRITSPSQKVELSHLSKGCYLIKVGKNTVRKISVN